jgi:hypothetical protein
MNLGDVENCYPVSRPMKSSLSIHSIDELVVGQLIPSPSFAILNYLRGGDVTLAPLSRALREPLPHGPRASVQGLPRRRNRALRRRWRPKELKIRPVAPMSRTPGRRNFRQFPDGRVCARTHRPTLRSALMRADWNGGGEGNLPRFSSFDSLVLPVSNWKFGSPIGGARKTFPVPFRFRRFLGHTGYIFRGFRLGCAQLQASFD